jgi:hypothetical protein
MQGAITGPPTGVPSPSGRRTSLFHFESAGMSAVFGGDGLRSGRWKAVRSPRRDLFHDAIHGLHCRLGAESPGAAAANSFRHGHCADHLNRCVGAFYRSAGKAGKEPIWAPIRHVCSTPQVGSWKRAAARYVVVLSWRRCGVRGLEKLVSNFKVARSPASDLESRRPRRSAGGGPPHRGLSGTRLRRRPLP